MCLSKTFKGYNATLCSISRKNKYPVLYPTLSPKKSKQNVTVLLQLHSLKSMFLTFPQPDPGGRRGPEAPHGCLSCWGDAVWLCTRRWRPLKGLVHSENTQAHNTGRLSFSRAKAVCHNFPGNCCPPPPHPVLNLGLFISTGFILYCLLWSYEQGGRK